MRHKPSQPFTTIPKKLHIIWVGDESKCPHQWIQTWRDHHPTWEFKLWGNFELDNIPWRSRKQIEIFRAEGQWAGVADLMRYEILYEHGGVYVDADSLCIRALDDWLLDTRMFAPWENEEHRAGSVSNGYIGAIPNHPALAAIVKTSLKCLFAAINDYGASLTGKDVCDLNINLLTLGNPLGHNFSRMQSFHSPQWS